MDAIKALMPLLVAFFSALLPLLSTPGSNLEYEYSLLVSYLFLIIYPASRIFIPFRPLIPIQHVLVIVATVLLSYLPGAIIFLLECGKCSDKGWFFWHTFHIIPIFIATFTLSDFYIYISKKTSKKVGIFLHSLFLLSQLMLVAHGTYFNGMAKTHGFFYGFLHGPIYDKLILVDNGTIRTQYFYFIIAIAMMLGSLSIRSARKSKKNLYSSLAAFLCFISTIFLWNGSNYYSSPDNNHQIERFLDKKFNASNFTILYSSTKTKDSSLDLLKNQISFHIEDLELQYGLRSNRKIEIYLYPDPIMKKKIFGGYHTDVADVRTPAIHISEENFPHSTLRHELVHAVLSEWGVLGLGFHPNMAITEGLAVALDPRERAFSLDQAAGYLVAEDKLSDPKEIFSPLFWTKSAARSYSVAGSLLDFIIANHGLDKAISLFSGESWNQVFKNDRDSIIPQWKKHVLSQYDRETQKLYTSRFFRSKGVLHERCPHTIASLALFSENQRLFHPSSYNIGSKRYEFLNELFPENRSYELKMLRNLQLQEKITIDKLTNFINNPPTTTEDITALIYLADEYHREAENDKALETLKMLKKIDSEKSLGRFFSNSINLRYILLSRGQSDDYKWYSELARQNKAEPLPTIGSKWEYLFIYVSRHSQLPSLDYLDKFEPTPIIPATLKYTWYKKLIYKSIVDKRFNLAEKNIKKIKLVSSTQNRSHIEFLERFNQYMKDSDVEKKNN